MRSLLLLPLLAAACAAPAPPTEGRWFGTTTPNPPRPGCEASRASLSITRGQALFTPDERTWTLNGTATATSVTAERIGTGANKQPYPTRFEARLEGDRITGLYTTPRCQFDVSLARP